MRRRLLAAVFAFLVAPAAFADPFYLPPFLSRAPALGDRWVYAAYDLLGNVVGDVTVEVVEWEETSEGWRYRVEDQLAFLPELGVPAGPVHRHEWFHRKDGTILHGDWWSDGVLAVDVKKPLVVTGRGRRFEHLGWPKPRKRRGRLSLLLLPGGRPPLHVDVRLGDRSRPTLRVSYDERMLGRTSWTDRFGLQRRLVSAVIDGDEWESPFIPLR